MYRLFLRVLNCVFIQYLSVGAICDLVAQHHDVTELSPVVLHMPTQPKQFEYGIDSMMTVSMLGMTMDQSISMAAPFYIKNYGLGNISTGSYRGGNASQVGLYWNGLNIQNINSGNVDFSLIPSSITDETSFSSAASNSSFGQINLVNHHNYRKGLQLQLANHYALHDVLSNQLNIKTGGTKHSFRGSLLQRKGQAQYRYADGEQILKQEHSALYQKNVNFDYSYRSSKEMKLSFSYWGQNYDREVPAALNLVSYAHQNDRFNRFLFQIEKENKRCKVILHQAFLDETLRYHDFSKGIASTISSNNWIQNLGLTRKFGAYFSMHTQINNSYQYSNSNNYNTLIHRNIFYVNHTSMLYAKKTKTHIHGFVKAELVNSLLNPLQYGITINQNLYRSLQINVQGKRYLRNPTFNDLYWADWGNPDLKPEYGFVYDVDLIFEKKYKQMTHKAQLGVYSKKIEDWIIWLPINASLWHAQNARKVWARGMEVSENITFRIDKVNLMLSGYYSYTRSTYEQNNRNYSENIIDKQLIYVPPHQASITVGASYKGFSLRYSHQYTSWRFTSSDNVEFLPAYDISSLYLNSHVCRFGNHILSIDCRVDNLFNKDIHTVANIPMPLRTFKIGIIYKLN